VCVKERLRHAVVEHACAVGRGLLVMRCLGSLAQIQHLYVTLGPKAGGRGRTALSMLKADYEKSFKYTGKV
jgi:hypothetical protein